MFTNAQIVVVLEAAMSALAAADPLDERDRVDINEAVMNLFRIKARRSSLDGGAVDLAPPQPDSSPLVTTDSKVGSSYSQFEYADTPLSEAGVAYLKTLKPREIKSATDIAAHVSQYGYVFEGDNPSQSATAAFGRRAKSIRDIILVERGRWGLREWYTQREINSFSHRQRTKDGMSVRRASGKTVSGRNWKLNETQAAAFKRLAADGASNAELGSIFGLATGTASNYKTKLRDWNVGDPFPPQQKTDEDGKQGQLLPLRAVE